MNYRFKCNGYEAVNVKYRYVRNTNGVYEFCEVGEDRRYDMAQGTVDSTLIPDEIRAKVDSLKDMAYRYVAW